MTWKNILKLDIEEARQLGDKYAPEDMKEDETDKKMAEGKQHLRIVLQRMKDSKDINPRIESGYRSTLQLFLRDIPNAPRLAGKNFDQMISLVEDFLEGKQTTSLVDRAKEMNRKHPRMGSGRDTEEKSAGPVSSKTSGVHRVSYSNRRDKDGKDE
tara:strand:- start:331 stop:798 length:468 start_codon:yes stop_codon:yes gene_type:complete